MKVKQNKKRGFTLIELLGVIVVLALLALILTPIILNVIEETEKNRFLENTKQVVHAIEQYNGENDMKATGQYAINRTDVQYIELKDFDSKQVNFKGDYDGVGMSYVNASGLVRISVENDTWCVFGTSKEYKIEKGKCSEVGNIYMPTYTIDKTGWQPRKIVTIHYPEREEGFVYDYSLDGGKTWNLVKSGTEKKIEFTQNGSVIARVYDGLTYQAASSFMVTQVDPTAPENVVAVVSKKTSNSITVTAAGEDKESGITKIEYSKDGGKTWVSKNGKETTHRFTKLKTGTYSIQIRMTNAAGLSTKSNIVTAKTNEIIPPTYAVDKTGWQPKKVVTVTYPKREEDFVYEYSLDGGKSWKLIAAPSLTHVQTFTADGSIIARINDGVNYVTASTLNVTQIDTTPPTSEITLGGRTSSSITLNAVCKDDRSGITKIEYSKDNGKTYVDGSMKNVYTFSKLTEGSYYFKVRCTNGAGLKTESTTLSGNPLELLTPTYSIDKTGWQPQKIVTIQYQAREINYIYQYSLDGGKSWIEVPAPMTSHQVVMKQPGSIIARVTDGVNYKTASAFNVSQVDSTAPSVTASVASKTSNSVQIKANCVDNESGITLIEYSKDNGATWNANNTTATYSYTGLKTGTYNFKVRCTNGAKTKTESQTVSSTTNKIGMPSYSVDKQGWQTSKNVTVTYPVREANFVYQYSLDGGRTWTTLASPATSKTITFTKNGNVIARVTDGVNYVTASSFNVTQIDTTAPTVTLTSPKKTTSSVSLKATCADGESGITKIEFSKDNGASYIDNGTKQDYTFGSLKTGTYTFKARCTNGSKLQTVSTALTMTPNEITPPTYKIDKTGWQQKKVVTITYPTRESGFVYQYSLDGGKSWSTVASPATTQQLTFTKNGSVIARVYDGTNYVTASTFNVTQIDTTGASATASITKKTSNSATIAATCTDNESGITKIEYSKNNGESYTGSGTSKSYTFNGLKTGTYTFKVKCTNGSGIVTYSNPISTDTVAIGTPSYTVDKTGWQQKKIVTISYPARQSNFTYQYSIDGGKTWTTIAAPAVTHQVPFTKNGSVIARIYDGTNYVTASTFNVTQIDTSAVTAALAVTSKTSNSVSLSATCTSGASGVAKYAYSKDNGSTFVDAGKNKTYTFTGLKTGTYNFKVRCTSGSGIVGTSLAVSATTNQITPPTYKVDKTGWQQKKIVTITYPARQSNFTYQYSIDGGKTWTTVASPAISQNVTFTKNGSVIARIYDGTNYVSASAFNVTQIDATPPTAVASVSGTTSNSITVSATCTDNESGISKIEYSKDNGASYTANGTNKTYTFTGLKTGTYNFKVRCTNGSLMNTVSKAVSGTTNKIGIPTYAVDKTGWQQRKVVTITYPARQSNFTYQYSIDGGKTWTTVAAPATTKQVTFTQNGTVIARVTDGINYVSASTFNVTQIDTAAPSASVTVATTHNSATLTASCSDSQSGISKIEYSKDNGANYIANGTNKTYTFSSLTTGTYNFKVRCTDGVQRQTASAVVSKKITNTITVTYNANGGSVSPGSKTATPGGTYGTLPTPTRTGHDFAGWYTAASGGTQVTSSSKVGTSNITLYAHWNKKSYILTYNANGGSVNPKSKTVPYQSAYGTLPTPTRAHFKFLGWFTAASGGSQVSTGTAMGAGNVTIYAHWQLTSMAQPTIYNPTGGNWTNKDFPLTLQTTSESSTISYWEYTYDHKTWNRSGYAGMQKVTTSNFSAQRNQPVYYRVCNNSGICSPEASTMIRIDKGAPILRCGTFTVWYQGAGSWGASGYDAKYVIYRGNDSMQGYGGVRTQGIRASWYTNMSGAYYAYWGGQNGEFANYGIRWGDYGVDTWFVHCKHTTACGGQDAWLYEQWYDQDRAGNQTGWNGSTC